VALPQGQAEVVEACWDPVTAVMGGRRTRDHLRRIPGDGARSRWWWRR
jgi:hypothetical protein